VLVLKLRGDVAKALASEGLPGLDPPFKPALPKEFAPALALAVRPVRIGWGREYFFEKEEGDSDPWNDAIRDQTVRAIDMKDYERARALGEELLGKNYGKRDGDSDSSNDPLVVALVAESIRLGGGNQRASAAMSEWGAAASLSYLSKKSSSSSSSEASCHPWILFVRAMAAPPGDYSCLPEEKREGFARGLEIARRQGWPLTAWARAVRTGRP
jgi:hypothetical protein